MKIDGKEKKLCSKHAAPFIDLNVGTNVESLPNDNQERCEYCSINYLFSGSPF